MRPAWGPAALLLALAGCVRTHMSADFGEAGRKAFVAQVIDREAGSVARPDQPLDPEEAAAVARTYRKSLAPPETSEPAATRSPILVVPPPSSGGPAAAAGSGSAR